MSEVNGVGSRCVVALRMFACGIKQVLFLKRRGLLVIAAVSAAIAGCSIGGRFFRGGERQIESSHFETTARDQSVSVDLDRIGSGIKSSLDKARRVEVYSSLDMTPDAYIAFDRYVLLMDYPSDIFEHEGVKYVVNITTPQNSAELLFCLKRMLYDKVASLQVNQLERVDR